MATTLLLRIPAGVARRGKIVLKIIVSSLNLIPTPPPDKIFNAHPLDFFNANFDVPEVYCFAAGAASNLIVWQRGEYDTSLRVSEESLGMTDKRRDPETSSG